MKNQSRLIREWTWKEEIRHRDIKEKIAASIASKVRDGEVIGAGSGSTSFVALQAIARRVHAEHLRVLMIPTSFEITLFCNQLGLPVTTLSEYTPDWSFDGTDEVDPAHNLIKGRGPCLGKNC